jgi:hypothetical protein
MQNTSVYALILKGSQGKRDGVPVSWLSFKYRTSKINSSLPNSAGMVPGDTKIGQNMQNASLCRNIEGKSGGKRGGVPVSWLLSKCSSYKFANLPNSAGMGPKTQSKHTKNKSRYRTGTISLRNANLCLNFEVGSGGRGMEYR